MLLLIDHYDSFSAMIADYCRQLKPDCRRQNYRRQNCYVVKTDQLYTGMLTHLMPSHIIIGPGPGHPNDPQLAAVRIILSQAIALAIPILGICLGHQIIAEYFGARVVPAQWIAHGLVSEINHQGDLLFKGVPQHFMATRYHSLLIEPASLAGTPLHAIAHSHQDEIMAIRHHTLAIFGLQFHPESVMTTQGLTMLANFIAQHTVTS